VKAGTTPGSRVDPTEGPVFQEAVIQPRGGGPVLQVRRCDDGLVHLAMGSVVAVLDEREARVLARALTAETR